jgi:hypothetical protein
MSDGTLTQHEIDCLIDGVDSSFMETMDEVSKVLKKNKLDIKDFEFLDDYEQK